MGKAELDTTRTWVANKLLDGQKAFTAVAGALELAESIKERLTTAPAGTFPRSVYGLMHGDAVFARQVIDAAGLAQIAGRHLVSTDDLLQALRVLCTVGELVMTAI